MIVYCLKQIAIDEEDNSKWLYFACFRDAHFQRSVRSRNGEMYQVSPIDLEFIYPQFGNELQDFNCLFCERCGFNPVAGLRIDKRHLLVGPYQSYCEECGEEMRRRHRDGIDAFAWNPPTQLARIKREFIVQDEVNMLRQFANTRSCSICRSNDVDAPYGEFAICEDCRRLFTMESVMTIRTPPTMEESLRVFRNRCFEIGVSGSYDDISSVYGEGI